MRVDKSKWRKCKLEDCITSLRTGLNPRKNFLLNETGATNFYITVRELNGRGITISDKTDLFCDYAFPLINHRSNLEKGDVLFSGTGTIGRTALVHETPKNWNIKEGVYVIKPKQDILYSIFLLYYLHSAPLLEYCQTFSKGATIQSVPMAKLRSAEILLPPLNHQVSIASELDALQEVIVGYQEQIVDLDALAQSIFLDTFGDPVTNPKGWQMVSLKSVCSHIVDCPHSTPKKSLVPTDYPCIRTSELTDSGIDWTTMQYLDEPEYQKRIHRLKPQYGDLIYGREGTVGGCVMVPNEKHFSLGQRTMMFRPSTINSFFLLATFRSQWIRNQTERKIVGQTVKHINIKDLIEFTIPNPPMELQQQFAAQVEAIERQKELLRQQLADAEMLMAERMQYYFS